MGTLGTIVVVVVVLIIAAGFVGYIIGLYNSLIQVKNNIKKAWKNIDVLLIQRHDELPKLIDAVKGYMKHERDLLTKITQLRTGYGEVKTIAEKTRIENDLNREIGRLRVTLEQYPDLKASESFLQLQGRISAIESSISDRRELFNDSVNIYNIQIERFPALVLAKMMNYQRHAFLEVPEQLKQDVDVNAALTS